MYTRKHVAPWTPCTYHLNVNLGPEGRKVDYMSEAPPAGFRRQHCRRRRSMTARECLVVHEQLGLVNESTVKTAVKASPKAPSKRRQQGPSKLRQKGNVKGRQKGCRRVIDGLPPRYLKGCRRVVSWLPPRYLPWCGRHQLSSHMDRARCGRGSPRRGLGRARHRPVQLTLGIAAGCPIAV